MKTFSLFSILFIFSIEIFSQNQVFYKIEFPTKTIDTGEFKNYDKLETGNFWVINGKYENNLIFKILDANTQKTLFEINEHDGDAMIFKPKFFINSDSSIKIFMIEVAAEYSWGQKMILIKNDTIYSIGYLNYVVVIENGLSLSDYCILEEKENKIIMSFQDISIINWDDEDKIINGKDLKFELNTKEIKRID